MSGLNITVKCTEIEAVKDMISKLEAENKLLREERDEAYKTESNQLKEIHELESIINKMNKACEMRFTELQNMAIKNDKLSDELINIKNDKQNKLKEIERLSDFARNTIDNTVYNMLDALKAIYDTE